jgi:hypothetical protein
MIASMTASVPSRRATSSWISPTTGEPLVTWSVSTTTSCGSGAPAPTTSSEVVTVNRGTGQQRGEHGGVFGGEPDRRQCFVQARVDEQEMPGTAVFRDDHDKPAQIRPGRCTATHAR